MEAERKKVESEGNDPQQRSLTFQTNYSPGANAHAQNQSTTQVHRELNMLPACVGHPYTDKYASDQNTCHTCLPLFASPTHSDKHTNSLEGIKTPKQIIGTFMTAERICMRCTSMCFFFFFLTVYIMNFY